MMAKRADIPSLTGLRFLAAWLVVIGHTDSHIVTLLPSGFEYGWRVGVNVGMTLFFVLSGFVIHYNYGPSISGHQGGAIKAFFVARFARLYPLYLFALALEIAARGWSDFNAQIFWYLLPRYLTLTQNWTNETIGNSLIGIAHLGGAWSLSAEVFLYLFYLIAVYPLSQLNNAGRSIAAIIVLSSAASIFFGGHAFGYWLSDTDPYWLLDLSPYCRIPEFLLGVLLAQLLPLVPARSRAPHWLAIGGLLWTVAVFVASYWWTDVQAVWGFAPGIGALMFYFARYRSPLSRIIEHPIAVRLGDASYSSYLLHGFVFLMVLDSPETSLGFGVFRIAIAWMLVALVSLGIYANFEAPARRWIRSLVITPARAPAAAPSGD
jgi:peptidoglycan/LPS O-acetylase OafA/YrhL